ncbi:Xylanase [Candidatus Sulfotelmatomonas gaucii]|uniref:Xylanase n=1 Tax=Candidatus Sulfuritelmatomonas gaucii TaxID=2043161 RepID=A0A2N9L991_9BACT|nr:Xylanase [Candidatus Sulfotelmatomonas gaucii]
MKTGILIAAMTMVFSNFGLGQAPAWPPSADHLTMSIWPGTPPGEKANMPPEYNVNAAGTKQMAGRPYIRLTNVSTPTIMLYKPTVKNTGAAVVVFPGGGYQILSMDLEGTEVCDWLNQIGVTCVLLKYRVPDSGPYPKSAAALQDAQRAMGLVRQHAAEWGIDPHRVGVLGFSAGGFLSAAVSAIYDKRVYDRVDAADELSCRPDFAVVLYPGYLALVEQNFAPNPEIHPTADTPPTFLLQAEDDPVHVENAVTYFMELKKAKVPAELHVFAQGGHGYGLRPRDLPIMGWPKLVETWLHTIKVLPAE